ncbi:MAG: thrombospondin type 3 repeat-containing protein, partial [Chthoniobacteraceae bacterium]
MNSRCGLRAGALMCRWLLVFHALFALSPLSHAVVDLDGDGFGDVWALFHPEAVAQPDADADGDGQSNLKESAAGTDPTSAESSIRVTQTVVEDGMLHVHFPTMAGKSYQLQRSSSLSA